MKQKAKKVNITISNKYHYQAKNASAKYEFSQKDFAETAINSFLHTLQQAEIGGIAKEQMQEFIDWLLDSQSFQNHIIEHASAYSKVFVENQKKLEEELEEELKSKKKVETQKATTVQYKFLKFNNYDLSRVMEVTALDELKKD